MLTLFISGENFTGILTENCLPCLLDFVQKLFFILNYFHKSLFSMFGNYHSRVEFVNAVPPSLIYRYNVKSIYVPYLKLVFFLFQLKESTYFQRNT